MNIPESEIAERRTAWEALSRFFLDTELDERAIREIAAMIRASGYSRSQIEAILDDEIAPLLFWNASSIAGEWAAFDIGEIERSILDGRHLGIRRWYRFIERAMCRRAARAIRNSYWPSLFGMNAVNTR